MPSTEIMASANRQDWRNLIGDFILEFAEVEVEVFGIFEDIGDDSEFRDAKNYLFKERAVKAISLIESNVASDEIRRPIIRALNELIKLADEVRNLIAHNPVDFALESILRGGNEHEIRSFRNHDMAITYEQLQTSYNELQQWRESLFHSMYRVRVIETNKRIAGDSA